MVTRRVAPDAIDQALAKSADDIKVVIDFAAEP
jgi:hypothetical protein